MAAAGQEHLETFQDKIVSVITQDGRVIVVSSCTQNLALATSIYVPSVNLEAGRWTCQPMHRYVADLRMQSQLGGAESPW